MIQGKHTESMKQMGLIPGKPNESIKKKLIQGEHTGSNAAGPPTVCATALARAKPAPFPRAAAFASVAARAASLTAGAASPPAVQPGAAVAAAPEAPIPTRYDGRPALPPRARRRGRLPRRGRRHLQHVDAHQRERQRHVGDEASGTFESRAFRPLHSHGHVGLPLARPSAPSPLAPASPPPTPTALPADASSSPAARSCYRCIGAA